MTADPAVLDQHLMWIEAPASPLSSRPKWRDLQFSEPASDVDGSSGLPVVIPTEVEGSLHFGPNEQKIKPIESISIFSVHFTLNLPQESQLLGMTKGAPVLHVVVCAGNKNSRSLAESCLDQSRRDGGGASLTSSAISSPGWLTSSSSSGSMCTRTSATLATCCRT